MTTVAFGWEVQSRLRTPALQLWKRFVEEGVSTQEGISLKAGSKDLLVLEASGG